MFDSSSMSIWYGRLKTSKSTTIVIFDPTLPKAPNGQVYLYNAERGAIIKYVAKIVTPLLEDIDKTELGEIKKALKKPWGAVRKAFINEHGGRGLTFHKKAKASGKAEGPLSEIDNEIGIDDIDWSDADEMGMV